MMRLPMFEFFAPREVGEAAEILARAEGRAMVVAGGTDLIPNMKRRQQVPEALVSLRRIGALHGLSNGDGLRIGSGVTLSGLLASPAIAGPYTALRQAAAQVATPHLRNMGTLGGNLCLDTRCNYYDQNYEWRKAIDFCMKKDGATCWVALSSPKCLAVSSSDTAPALLALDAAVTLVSARGTRDVALDDFYRNDGIQYLSRAADEILTEIVVPARPGWRSTYWKLRRRGSFDFPVLSVAAAVALGPDGVVEDARIVLGAVASRPLLARDAAAALVGRRLDDDALAHAAELAARPSRPMDNTDFTLIWRKKMTRDFVAYALGELRGDDMRAVRRRVARQLL
jgi:4-hydroxybenzoyl-CoA reductase subunit beta